jgi:hypothetical protein
LAGQFASAGPHPNPSPVEPGEGLDDVGLRITLANPPPSSGL